MSKLSTERSNNLPEITQLVRGRVGFEIPGVSYRLDLGLATPLCGPPLPSPTSQQTIYVKGCLVKLVREGIPKTDILKVTGKEMRFKYRR